MNVRDLLPRRRQILIIPLVGLALSLLTSVYLAVRPGVYWASTHVILHAPAVPDAPNTLQDGSSSLISMAGIIERQLNGRADPLRPTGPQVTLVDRGIYDGSGVRVPNYGGQWANNFSQPVLDVEASGRSPEVVRERVEGLVTQIALLLKQYQDDAGVRSSLQITMSQSPDTLAIHYSDGARGRSAVVCLLLGSTLSVLFSRRFWSSPMPADPLT